MSATLVDGDFSASGLNGTALPDHAVRYLARAELLAWDRTALSECVLDPQLAVILHTVASLERDTAISAQQARSFGLERSADLSAFLPVWEREEAEHSRALRYLLDQQSYIPPELPLRSSRRRRCIASVPVRACGQLPHTSMIFCAMGAAAESVTILVYTELARMTAEPDVASLLHSITRQEGRHLAFFLAAARARASRMSRLDGFVARRLFDRLWQPPGVPSIGRSAWQSVFAPLLRSEELYERVQRMDRVVDTIPYLDGMNLMQTFLQGVRRSA